MKYRYIGLDDNGIAVSDSRTDYKADNPDFILYPPDAPSPIGKQWTGSEFVDAEVPPIPRIVDIRYLAARMEPEEFLALRRLPEDGYNARLLWELAVLRYNIDLDGGFAAHLKSRMVGDGIMDADRAEAWMG